MPFPSWYFNASCIYVALPSDFQHQLMCAQVFLSWKHRLIIFYKVKTEKQKTQLIPVRKNK